MKHNLKQNYIHEKSDIKGDVYIFEEIIYEKMIVVCARYTKFFRLEVLCVHLYINTVDINGI